MQQSGSSSGYVFLQWIGIGLTTNLEVIVVYVGPPTSWCGSSQIPLLTMVSQDERYLDQYVYTISELKQQVRMMIEMQRGCLKMMDLDAT
ncbi:unnamed protein product [Vicia faba]|uniref:Uncharacterized protein n=1 Tax=Vicia faba TaxID=3906 RepID=A0AAV1BEJ3_VICFA|nr:unnamed protein product [Vicia faba]